ncbi:hypothetical protein [Stutzerimonas nitrititolerans]|uniref:hypothetical protein n=1 Tax=Stutzerimonas nitrititolerans TaxID=2482751 RepID=UPI0028AD5A54|nr:hypothetical protein [Stutzerimonas nitrititolerans]
MANDAQQRLQTLLDRIARDSRAAQKLASELYAEGFLFCESDHLYVMDGDEDAGGSRRQKHIRLEANGICPIGGGAW